jgi:hypothetical protein
MNRLIKYISFVSLLACLQSAWADSSLPIRLRGVMISESLTIFSINCVETGSSGWFGIGRSFCGYELVEFDETRMTLQLKYGEGSYYLKLSDRSEISGESIAGNTAGGAYGVSEYLPSATGRIPVASNVSRSGRLRPLRDTHDLKSVASPQIAEVNAWSTHYDAHSILPSETGQTDSDGSGLVRRRNAPQVKKVPRPSQFIVIEN